MHGKALLSGVLIAALVHGAVPLALAQDPTIDGSPATPMAEPAGNQLAYPPLLTLVLAPDDEVAVLQAALAYWRRTGRCFFPEIIAMEPGPLELRGGLRLLPNQVVPRLRPPDGDLPHVLLISNLGRLAITNPFLAYLRVCMARGVRVWVVGDRLPPALADHPLDPGQTIELLPLPEMEKRLCSLSSPNKNMQSKE